MLALIPVKLNYLICNFLSHISGIYFPFTFMFKVFYFKFAQSSTIPAGLKVPNIVQRSP